MRASAGRSRAGFDAERSCRIGAVEQIQVHGSCAEAAAAKVVPQSLLPLQRRTNCHLLLRQMMHSFLNGILALEETRLPFTSRALGELLAMCPQK